MIWRNSSVVELDVLVATSAIFNGATTHSITTFSIMTFSIMAFRIMTLNTMMLINNDSQHNK
jgi:hypothetical protein